MRRSWVLFLFCLFTVSLVLTQLSSANTNLKVNEADTRLLLEDKQTLVSLVIENPAGRSFPAQVRLEAIDPNGQARAVVESEETIKRGNSALVIPLPLQLTNLSKSERNEMLWYRLRYQVTPLASSEAAGIARVEGIVSLSEITPDIFQVNVTAPEKAREGTRYRAQVRTLHPVTSRPVKGVQVEALMDFDTTGSPEDMKVSGVTDVNGYASLDFELPRKMAADEDELDLKIVARRGILVEEADTEIEVDHSARIFISTDKPLYQPGQALHIRALVFDAEKRAVTDSDATLEIEDPESQTVFSAEIKTSRFGIASADWTIPDNIRLGDYRIKVEIPSSSDTDEAYASVKISRYELPNFAVQVKPDLPYYLPGQNAVVEVRADYLFGQPVKRGHVRVVRETERSWNYREQKWETAEAEKYEGETNADGSFTAPINLSEEQARLQKEDYTRFRDLSYAAYFTDPTTNRTEQRRFDLRLTKSAIHVYLIETGSHQAKDFPLEFYLSTYYADGTPAQCEVTITEGIISNNPAGSSLSFYERPLRSIKTNRYGLAKVSDLSLTKQAGEDREATLTFLAHDGKGAQGRQTNSFWYSDHGVIRLETNKTLYRQGEPIRVEVAANEPEMKVVLDLWQGSAVLQSRVVQLHNGHAVFTVPYNEAFKDAVTITAYSYTGAASESRYDMPSAMRRVLYPTERDLKLDVRLDQSTYKPGEEAHVDFTVRSADGQSIESALGVVVFDKAVEERARTDREFGSNYGFYSAYNSLNGYESELSGLTIKDFFKLDLARPVPEGMELAAEIMLRGDYSPHIFGSDDYSLNQREIFSKLIARQVKPMEEALAAHYADRMEYPNDEASLRRLLTGARLDFDRQRDPWGTPFRAAFETEREMDVLKVASAGADKRFDTDDDFIATRMIWPYFRPTGETLNRAVEQYHERTGGYLRDAATVRSEWLASGGVDFQALRDRWGKPFQLEFDTSGTNYTVVVKSGGPNGKFETGKEVYTSDDFIVWTAFEDYFKEKREELRTALANRLRLTGLFPQNEMEMRAQLDKGGVKLEALRDPWGHSYYLAFSNDPRFAAPFVIQTLSTYEDAAKKVKVVSPLTQPNNLIRVRSLGPDGVRASADDFDVAALSRKEIELLSKGQHPSQVTVTATLTGASGAITGTLTDPQGAVVPGATVTATNASSSAVYETTTDDNGRFVLANLPVGFYTVRFESPGFSAYVIEQAPVRSSNITRVDGSLQVAGVSETVSITSGGAQMSVENSTNAARSMSYVAEFGKSAGGAMQAATPRLREYFPETLVWQPLLETDARGRTEMNFKLADNITTWKMAVIGSTQNGEVGIVEKEIRAFQPFFVEHDPPRVLTEGDEIQLPVVLRNYLDKSQAVELEMKPENWFALTGPASKRAEVAAGESSRQTFDFRAVASVHDGKQRITALGSEASDAIEKPVSVHPDGEERAVTTSGLLGDTTTLRLNIPTDLIKSSLRAELKIYPNLLSHIAESVEGILVRPHGCGEQTISSTYPNLMILRFNKKVGKDSLVTARARKYLEEGYRRLLNYRAGSGGFSYWGGDESADFALTAYALSFLNDAREFLEVDENVLGGARDFLIKQQSTDGSWAPASRYGAIPDTPRENLILTSYLARIIANVEAGNEAGKNPQSSPGQQGASFQKQPQPSTASNALKRALGYLSSHLDEVKDAYTLSSYALAAEDAGDASGARRAIAKLRSLAHADADGTVWWEPEAGTPFHGWGKAGSIETTALALQALNKYCGMQNAGCGMEDTPVNPQSAIANPQPARPQPAISIPQLMDRALLYLLRGKDRYGVWQSTQATINVLNALVAIFNRQEPGTWTPALAGGGGQAEISINGRAATSLTIPPGRLNNPVMVDISQFISPGENQITIRRESASLLTSAQIVSTFYVPWSAAKTSHVTNAASNPLRLSVNFSKVQISVNEEVTCKVEAAGRNYGGMMLAEIGLPPGADVDRASLDLAVKNSGWTLSRYDVLPDRLIVYLWPRSDGNKFEFKFRQRFGLAAQSAPSLLYDYYNPEARTLVAPTKFVVR
ncbi:MAG TPA: MG2 domain-containing protein [Pyrinomonadaceae bacterium]|nr:MG2 domain-containing protein [Pyrinomonadaceae bacterium]